ncbi:MAG: end-binding protein Ku [Actinomycetota bacterium]|nr:end-binding protein Ku [Actinomycetota bacterium]
MPRAIWTGSISFGLVNVPVKVYSAVKPQDVHFHQMEERTGARVRNKRVSEKTGREVDYEDIVKGYEFAKGKYVTVTPEEIEEFKPEATKTIDIEDFVELDDIDPIFYDKTYILAPASKDRGAVKAYALLLEAMRKQGRVGIGRVVLRTKQYLAAIRPLEKANALAMSTMLFEDEVVPASEIPNIPDRMPSVSDKELQMATRLVESLTTEWKPAKYKDTYRKELLDLIERKAKGEEIVVDDAAPQAEKIVDLMAALEASLAAAKKGTKAPAKSATKATKATKAKKATKKRAAKKRTTKAA